MLSAMPSANNRLFGIGSKRTPINFFVSQGYIKLRGGQAAVQALRSKTDNNRAALPDLTNFVKEESIVYKNDVGRG
jgi:hypothetical protein